MREWFKQLGEAPEPLSPMQRRLVWLGSVIVALSRLAALARSLWDWDEALFSTAVRAYDVTQHHPHPPGFPYFIGLAKGLHLVVGSEFRSLQLVTLAGACALFPLMVLFGVELRARFSIAYVAALLLVFFPNVWFFGGTAFSDIPSLALVLCALVLLLRGCRDRNAYLAGALVLGVAAGFRPQNLLVGLVPALLATWLRVRSTRSVLQPLGAIAIGLGVIVAGYGGAVQASGGWQPYRETVAAHSAYITAVDSYRSPTRPPLALLFDDFFIKPYRVLPINIPIALLVTLGVFAGLLGRRRGIVLLLAIFGPFCLVGWLMLDHNSVSRFSIAWAPMIAFAAACGLSVAAVGVAAILRRPSAERAVEGGMAVCLLAMMIVWTLPALKVVRTTDSPPMQAVHWIRANLSKDTALYVHGSMGPYSDLLLGDYRPRLFNDEAPLLMTRNQKAWVLKEGVGSSGQAQLFAYPHRHLWEIARQRYFEVSVEELSARVRFGEGWNEPEGDDGRTWRWMGSRSSAILPPIPGCARLTLHYYVPLDAVEGTPTVVVKVNGQLLDRFAARESVVERSLDFVSRSTQDNELVMETDRFVTPSQQGLGADGRTLGVRLDYIGWAPEPTGCRATPIAR
ncbi:MAG: hypothetical protein ABI779_17455 [Acidobacteriota bacterium]